MNALYVGEMIWARIGFSLFAMVLVAILYITLQRLIGLNSVTFLGLTILRIKTMYV